jgi:hypothetical protein
MTRISSFVHRPSQREKLHPTEVDCGWHAFEVGGRRIVQLDTFGSGERQMRDKLSQTIQLEREAAAALVTILRREFPGL